MRLLFHHLRPHLALASLLLTACNNASPPPTSKSPPATSPSPPATAPAEPIDLPSARAALENWIKSSSDPRLANALTTLQLPAQPLDSGWGNTYSSIGWQILLDQKSWSITTPSATERDTWITLTGTFQKTTPALWQAQLTASSRFSRQP